MLPTLHTYLHLYLSRSTAHNAQCLRRVTRNRGARATRWPRASLIGRSSRLSPCSQLPPSHRKLNTTSTPRLCYAGMQTIGSVLTQRQTQLAEDTDGDALLLEQLKALSDWAHGSTSLAIKLSSPQERKNCMAVVRNFYNHVINEFPLPGEYAWDACNEKVKLTEASFDVFSLVGAAFCAEDDFREFSRQFLTRVLNICRVLEEWIDVQDTRTRPGYPTPRELYEKGELACIGLLRAWFGCLKAEVKDVRGWQVAKEIAAEWVTLIQGHHYSFPARVVLNIAQNS